MGRRTRARRRSRASRRGLARRGGGRARPGRHEPEQRAVERVDPGREDPQVAEAEPEDRVLGVAGVDRHGAARLERGEVRGPAHRRVERREEIARPGARAPRRPRASASRPRSRPSRGCARRRGTRPGSGRWRASSPLWPKAKRPPPSRNGWVSAIPSHEKRDGRRRWTSAAVVSVRPTSSRAGSSRKAVVAR